MKATTFGKATVSLASALALSVGLGIVSASATPAALTSTQEDPTTSTYLTGAPVGPNTLVGVGSDTTQDVEYGISQDLGTIADGSLNVASWTATGTTPLVYRSGGAPTSHPNGSGAGFKALEESIGLIPATSDQVATGDVDFARAAGFQGTPVSGGAGALTEIPFALDALTFAVPAGSPFLKTNGGAGLTLADLTDIYTNTDTYIDTVDGTLLSSATNPAAPGDATEPIQGFLPKPGSGVRQTFLKQLNAINAAVPYGADKGDSAFTAAYPTTAVSPYTGAQTPAGTAVQQNDASVLISAPSGVAAIVPFSAAKYIGYHNGIIADPSTKTAGTDYQLVPFDSAVTNPATTQPEGAVLPYLTSNGTYVPNAAYKTYGSEGNAKLSLEAFNIIPTAAVANPNANVKYRALYDTFVGAASKFCLDTATAQAYGFLRDSNCGNTSQTAGIPSTATVTVSNVPSVAGTSSLFTVGVQSNGNGGGTINLTINGKVYSGTIAAGHTSVQLTVPTPAAGTFSYGGNPGDSFEPALPGVAPAPIAAGTYSVAKATATIRASAPTVSHLRIGSVTAVVTASGVKVTGTVGITVKTTTGLLRIRLSAKTLVGGKVTASLGRTLPRGTYYVWVSYSGNANISSHGAVRAARLLVT